VLAGSSTLLMKTMIALCAVLALPILSLLGEDPKGGQALLELQSPPRAQKEEKKAQVNPSKGSTNEIFGTRVFYGGYFTEFLKAERKRPLFNLKTPLNPAKDIENLWFQPGTDKIQGVVLFSIKF
jgi:hypothetical protein